MEQELNRDRIQKIRAAQTEDEKEVARIYNKIEHKYQRADKSEEKKEFDRINQKHSMRNMRQKQSGKEHLLHNLKAKQGMKILKEEGNLKDFAPRSRTNRGTRLDMDLNDWDEFKKQSETHAELLEKKKPDVGCQLNEKWRKIREEKDNQKKKREDAEKKGEFVYNAENDEYFWSGPEADKPDLEFEDTFCYDFCEPLTEEQLFFFSEKRRGRSAVRP